MSESLNEKIDNAEIVFESTHPITFDHIIIKELDGHNYWIENNLGEGMQLRKRYMTSLFNDVHEKFNKIFKVHF